MRYRPARGRRTPPPSSTSTIASAASDKFIGEGFTYDKDVDLTTGTITGFTFVESKTAKFQVS